MIKYRITKIDKEGFFLKVGAVVYLDLLNERVYAEDKVQYAPLKLLKKLNADGEQIKEVQ